MELTDKVVFISGSTRGIGATTALKFAKAGSRLILNGRQDNLPKALKEKLDLLGTEYHYLKGDIANEESVSELAATAWQIYEKIDILINNAGITNDKLMMGMKASDFDQVINVNLRGTFMLTQPIFKKMLKKEPVALSTLLVLWVSMVIRDKLIMRQARQVSSALLNLLPKKEHAAEFVAMRLLPE